MIPYDHQIEIANLAYPILRDNMMVYLACEERTGKTLSAILLAELCDVTNVQVITKKTAIKGWSDTLKAYSHKKIYSVTNYHQAKKVTTKPDLLILDESHNYISSYPKTGQLWKDVAEVARGVPIIYISATPHAQGPQQLFHQFKLSTWSPWAKYKNFYRWFEDYGRPYTLPINGINIPQYDRVNNERVLADVAHLFVTKTRKDLGFEHEPEDQLHYITLNEATCNVYNDIVWDNISYLSIGPLVCDTAPKVRTSLHQIEGGTIKIDDDYYVLANNEKVDYVLSKFGDVESLVIMYNYKAELQKLQSAFSNATLLQATSFAEGVDLSGYKDLVIYSQDFSTARHTQRRARQCNKKRSSPIVVHYLLVKGAISDKCYKRVSVNKKNFVDTVFTGI